MSFAESSSPWSSVLDLEEGVSAPDEVFLARRAVQMGTKAVHPRTLRGPEADVEEAAVKIDAVLGPLEAELGGRKAALGRIADRIGVSSMWLRRVRGRFGGAIVQHWQMQNLNALLEAELERQQQRFELARARLAATLNSEKENVRSETRSREGVGGESRVDVREDRILVARDRGALRA